MADDIYNFITSTGVILVDAGVILADVAQEYKNVFGQDLVVPDSLNIEGASTPQGLLIVSEALARIAAANNNASLANQINPNLAGGIFLDSIMQLMGLQRTPATSSVVLCTLTGTVGTSIPAGSQASVDVTGEVFESTSTIIIPTGGSISNVEFKSVETGAIAAPATKLINIVSNVLGWETITNPNDAVLGQATQSDVAARTLRLNTLAIQGSSVAEAIMSGISIVQGVKSLTFRENVESTTQVIDGVSLVANSIYACVDGGTDLAVAEALVSKKSAGAAYNNTTGAGQGIPISQNVTIPYSGQIQTVLFDRPTPVQILVAVVIKVITPVQDPFEAVRSAIVQYANGEIDGLQGLIVGQNVSSFELAGAVATLYPGIYVQSLFIAKSPTTPVSSAEIAINIYEIATIDASDITVNT